LNNPEWDITAILFQANLYHQK